MNMKKQYNDPRMELYRLEQTERIADKSNDGEIDFDEDETV